MVFLYRMAQLMQNDIINQFIRQFHQLDIQTDFIVMGATAPIGDIIPEREAGKTETKLLGILPHPAGQQLPAFLFVNLRQKFFANGSIFS